jgi:hypothetical protein
VATVLSPYPNLHKRSAERRRAPAQVAVNVDTPGAVLAGLEAALKPVFEDAAHNKELGAWFAVRLVGCADPLKLELGIAWECSHQGAPARARAVC